MATRATASGRQRLAMEPDATTNARIAALHEEIPSIHFATKLFWEQKAHSSEARAEHYRRQDRLEEIRSELAGTCCTDRRTGIVVLSTKGHFSASPLQSPVHYQKSLRRFCSLTCRTIPRARATPVARPYTPRVRRTQTRAATAPSMCGASFSSSETAY
jgi:hypothetical protein